MVIFEVLVYVGDIGDCDVYVKMCGGLDMG